MTVNESPPNANDYVLMPSKNPDEPTGMYMCTKHRVNGEYVDDETYNASLHNKDQQLQIIKQQGGTTMLSTHTPATCIERGVELADYLLAKLEED